MLWTNRLFTLNTATVRGRIHILEANNNLSGNDWQVVVLVRGDRQGMTLRDEGTPLSQRYYRLTTW